ncbi:hypothetical protein OWM54_43105 [Myxococcus sp. MISCRS1]|uniref:hypothetical protein n=1 Tax=Myxococcus sp. MISCRS1 TaxID=2996786 RepID=UPI00226DCF3E|nr:hypothetical protein [Myxococcus sp. MISCRS1]MCY1003955.1 hypothetical protein [Myxococcus sp. MISCRS1]
MFVGTKYAASRDGAAITKAIRDDIKAEQKAGRLSQLLKVSVILSRYSMGQTVYVRIQDAPIQIQASAYSRSLVIDPPGQDARPERYTAAATRLRAQLEEIAQQYQRSDSRPDEDYSNVNFFLRCEFGVGLLEVDHEISTDYWLALEDAL